MRTDEIKDRIRAAFPAVPFDGIVTGCECDECTDIRLKLQGKQWDEISEQFIDLTCSPVLLTPEAFCAFLPSYMVRALDLADQRDNNVVEFTVYSLSPGDGEGPHDPGEVEWRQKRARLMNREQIEAVRWFLLFIAEKSPEREWREQFVKTALAEVWK